MSTPHRVTVLCWLQMDPMCSVNEARESSESSPMWCNNLTASEGLRSDNCVQLMHLMIGVMIGRQCGPQVETTSVSKRLVCV